MNKILIIGYRHFYTLDNITSTPKKFIVHNKKGLEYVLSRSQIKNTWWILSFLFVINRKVNFVFIDNLINFCLKSNINKSNIKAFLSFTPNDYVGNFLFEQKINVQSIQILHGNSFSLNPSHPVHKQYQKWGYLLAWSEQMKEKIVNIGFKTPDKVYVIGRPTETYKQISNEEDLISNRILFIGEFFARKGVNIEEKRIEVFTELKEWAKTHDITLYYKPHPAEFRRGRRKSIKVARDHGMIITDRKVSENELIQNFDIIITIASSYGQELRLYKKHVIQYDFEHYIKDFGYDLTNVGVEHKCFSITELDAIYKKILMTGIKNSKLDPYYLASQEDLGFPIIRFLNNLLS